MNTIDRETHLTDDELLLVVVDAAALRAPRQAHLEGCDACRQALARLETDLARIGQKAQALAPAPKRVIRMADNQPAVLGRRLLPLWAAGAVAAILLVVAVWGPAGLLRQEPADVASLDMTADGELLAAVDALVENALPAPYHSLAYLAAPAMPDATDFDDDWTDWVIPSLDVDDSLS